MKKSILLALVLGLVAAGPMKVFAAGGGDAIVAVEISAEEAHKKYPPPAGKSYPEGIITRTSQKGGYFQSPYSSRIYDCRKLKHGAYILDEPMKKVFRKP